MIVAVDVGNSNVVVAAVEGDDILFEARLLTDPSRTADEYCGDVKTVLEIHGVAPRKIEGSIISSVVPAVQDALVCALRNLIGREPLTVGPGLKTGLKVLTDDPNEIGADLVVGSVAALRMYQPPVIMVDMGTATTIMALNKDGAFVGGCIAPGVRISMDALTGRTALLPDLELAQPRKAIGSNTVDCMRSGVLMGAACMLDGMVERMEAELGSKTTVVATGGIARFVIPMCRTPMIYDKDLLVKGLAILYRENKD